MLMRSGMVLAVVLLCGGAGAAELSGQPADMPDEDVATLSAILDAAGLAAGRFRSAERTPEYQARVMMQLAQKDLEAALAMYCTPGDHVIQRYSATATEAQNLEAMTAALKAELPAARAIGCLSHIQNDEVYSVDLPLSEVPTERQAALQKAAEAAVASGKMARFLAPPREPSAFHFEFSRPSAVPEKKAAANKREAPEKAEAGQAPADAPPAKAKPKAKAGTGAPGTSPPKSAGATKAAPGPGPGTPPPPPKAPNKDTKAPTPPTGAPKTDKSKGTSGDAPPKSPKSKSPPATSAEKKQPGK